MQIKEALDWAKNKLKDIHGGEKDALILLSAITHKDKAMIIVAYDEVMTQEEWAHFQRVINQRKQKKPVAQILKIASFWKWYFNVSEDTLIPRSDSEILIEAILADFTDINQEYKIADFGTGSGCLLLSALSEYPKAQGYGLDISHKALEVAKENTRYVAKQGGDFKPPQWLQGSWETLKKKAPFDIIIANPPYIAEAEKADLAADVLDYEPHQALFSGNDGLSAYQELFPLFRKILNCGGRAYIEHGYRQQETLVELAMQQGLIVERRLFDLANWPRGIVLANP